MKKVVNIIWDIDLEKHENYDDILAILGLPTEVDLPNRLAEEHISDYLSDKYGFCNLEFTVIDI